MKYPKPFLFYSDKLEFKTKDGKFFVKGHFSTGDEDLVADIVTKNCMLDMNIQMKNRSMKLDLDHEAFKAEDGEDPTFSKTKLPLGRAVDFGVDAKGNWAEWQLNENWKKFDTKGNITMTFKELWKSVEDRFYDAFSIAYLPIEAKFEERRGNRVRLLDRVNLFNVALTGNPVNPGASMSAVMAKSLNYMNEVDKLTEDNKKKTPSQKAGEEGQDQPPAEPPKTPEGGEGDASTAPDAGEGDAPKEPSGAAEVKSLVATMVEVKAELKKVTDLVSNLQVENADLKSIVEKARPKGYGAHDKTENKGQDTEFKTVGPLDVI